MTQNKILSSAGIVSGIGLATLSAFLTFAPMFVTPDTYADEAKTASGEVGVKIGNGLAVSATDVKVNVTPAMGTGENTFVTGRSTVNVLNTSARSGYYLTMSSKNGILTDTEGSDGTITSIQTDQTGDAMKQDRSKSSWGYTMSKVEGGEDDLADLGKTYKAIPTSSTPWTSKTASDTSGQHIYLNETTGYTDTEHGDDIYVGYGFAISPETVAGSYVDYITYTAVPNSYTVQTIFDVDNMQDFAYYQNRGIDVCGNTPTPAAKDSQGNIIGTEMKYGSTAELLNAGYELGQREGVNAVPTVTLKDTRDGNKYTIRKLADGNCWMSENLMLTKESMKDKTTTLSSMNTDLPLDREIKVNDYFPTSSRLDTDKTEFDTWPGGNGYTQPGVAYVEKTQNENYLGNQDYSLYNWFAATLEKTKEEGGDGTVNDAVAASASICPAGWQLPNKEGARSWEKLFREGEGVYEIATSDNKYVATLKGYNAEDGTPILEGSPFSIYQTGAVNNSSKAFSGLVYGYAWTRESVPTANTNAYHLSFDPAGVRPQSHNTKTWGYPVRCVSRTGDSEFKDLETGMLITTMQQMTSTICANVTKPKATNDDGSINANVPETTLVDTRDGNSYTVRKLADGNCWMTDDLRLTKESLRVDVLDSSNTDVDRTVTVNDYFPDTARLLEGNTDFDSNWVYGDDGYTNPSIAYVKSDQNANYLGAQDYALYNWFAATLEKTKEEGGDGTVNDAVAASASICPAGWQLPNNEGDRSWEKLFRQGESVYEIATSDDTYVTTLKGYDTKDSTPILAGDPFNLYQTGTANANSKAFSYPTSGYAWTHGSVPDTSTSAYSLDFYSIGVRLQISNSKVWGFPVRCVAK